MTTSEQHEGPSSEQTAAESGASDGRHGVEIRLPFLTITRGGHTVSEGAPGASASSAGTAAGLPELAFYGGAAALAAFGLIDWPVAALVAAGTYLARKSRGVTVQPPTPADASSVATGAKGEEKPRQASRRARTSTRGSGTAQRRGA